MILHPHVTRGLIVLGVLALVALGSYARLIVGPVQVPFVNDKIRELVDANLPEGFSAEYEVRGVMVENGLRPMVVISPFQITEETSGAKVTIESLRVAFAPFQALFGRPAADLILVTPHVQAVQDFLGIRLAALQFATNAAGETTVRILADESDPRPLVIDESGIAVGGNLNTELLSDNDWIVLMVNDMERLLAETDERFELGELRQIEIRQASVELIDQVYRIYRHFENVDLLVKPADGDVVIDLETKIGDRETTASVDYAHGEDGSSLTGTMSNVDLAVFLPMLDDEEGMFSLKGGAQMDFAMEFEPEVGVVHGRFDTDINGTSVQLLDDTFPLSGDRTRVEWLPGESAFVLEPASIRVGDTTTTIDGRFALGVDPNYGPTVGVYFRALNTMLNPYDLEPASAPIERVEVHGWSAAVYGAVGIDQLEVSAGDMAIRGSGRLDFLQRGIGIDLDLNLTNASIDQIKRIWPYFVGADFRDLFVSQVRSGTVKEANLSFDLDPGVVDLHGFVSNRVPDGGVFIDAVASDIELAVPQGEVAIDIQGETRMRLEDNSVTLNLARGSISSDGKVIELKDLAYYNTEVLAAEPSFEVSGVASGEIAALTAIANQEPYRLLEGIDLGVVPADLRGRAEMTIVAQVVQDRSGKLTGTDYTLNGTIEGFSSAAPIEGRTISDGTLALVASQAGFTVTGTASIDGVPTDLEVQGGGDSDIQFTAAAVLDAEARRALGFDFPQYIGGTVRYVSRPTSDGSLQIALDLDEASLTIDEIAVSKPIGEPGTLTASVREADGKIEIDQLDIAFGDVHLAGSITLSEEQALEAARFTTFQLNAGDAAALTVTPIEGGYAVKIEGEELDLKPVVSRYLGLSAESAEARSTTDTAGQVIELELDLDRALGFYRTTAFNAHFRMALLGNKLLRVDAQAQLGGDKSMSITTNSLPQGRVMTVAANDLGTLMRFIGAYPRMLGGEGSLVMATDDPTRSDRGEFALRNFAIVDEAVVAQILGNHPNSRGLIERQNRVDFTRGRAVFVSTEDHLTVTEGALHGDRIGGTLRGTIYTKERRYDLVGTYVPLFGLNNMFQQLPIVGRIVGGREGEGLIGVTFKVEGPLDNPQFRINPASILAPGVFRQLFEFRAQDAPPPIQTPAPAPPPAPAGTEG